MRTIKICIPIYFDESAYPSAGDDTKRRLIYWRSIAVLCASIRRAKVPEADILICTNETPPAEISGLLAAFGVSFVSPNFSFRPPPDLYPAFAGAFYLFDCMGYCRDHLPKQCTFAFLDPDCLVMDNLEAVRNCAHQQPIIAYELNLPPKSKENGCSREDLLAFLGSMATTAPATPPKYFGGEFLLVNGEKLDSVCEMIDQIWKHNMRNFKTGAPTLKTEEHVLSLALSRLGENAGAGSDFIKRMWTRPSLRNVSSADSRYSIWHLPAEKQYALQRLFELIESDAYHLANIDEAEFRSLVARFIKLDLPLIERPLYFFYPFIKRSAKRLAQLVPVQAI